MRTGLCSAFILLGLLACAMPGAAQQRVPFAGAIGWGGDVGFYVPAKEFEIGPVLSGFGEFYVTPRVSVRGVVSWTDPSFDRGTDDSLRQVSLMGNVLYNWEEGAWHPFIVGGVGVHFLQLKENDRAFGDAETKGGLNGGIGIEYFSRRDVAIKAEALYQWVAHDEFAPNPSGFSLKIGLKKYF